MKKITVIEGDISALIVDAIVNSAKSSLTGGSGVDGAIHRAAGPELLEECWNLDIAQEKGLRSIAFPCIGVGAFGIPHELAARTAIGAVRNHPFDGEVVLCCFSPVDKKIYDANLGLHARLDS